jgi:hypothetical protein
MSDRGALDALIGAILAETDALANPYFRALADGSLSRDDFVETQAQFYLAVLFFSRPMAALAAKIPYADLRMEVVRNVWEEHGEGDPARVHGTTFVTLMERLAGLGARELSERALWPEVRIFNTTLAGACVLDEYLIGAGMMGMIERTFCDVSRFIGQSIVARGWLAPAQMTHYTLHEELDIKHAQDFFDVLAPAWAASADNRYYIEQGLRMGATLFDNLYTGLYRARGRRWRRANPGPHSRA